MCKNRAMHRVVVLALDGVYAFELGMPARVLGAAHIPGEPPLYEVLTCTLDGAPVKSNAGFGVAADHDASVLATADTVILPPSEQDGRFTEAELPETLARALAGVRPGTRLVSLCTGSLVLARAGVLDGRPATTHWWVADTFRRAFPQVKLDADVLFVDDGDVLTAAGAAAGVDLCLHLLRRDHGSATANRAARRCVVPPWRDGGQAQFVERLVPRHTETSTAATREWAARRLHLPLALSELAAHARMSRRTFTRRFRDEVGMSPGEWVTQQRLDLARLLLESTELPVDTVAERSGFGTAASLRQHMRRGLGTSPSAYRRTFQTRAA